MQSAEPGIPLESLAVVQEHAERDSDSASRAAPSFESQSGSEAVSETWLQRHRTRIIGVASKAALLVSLVLTALMAWPTISSANDTRMATLLAEWTSQKEYLEFCEAVCSIPTP